MMNPAKLFKMKESLQVFQGNHPKFINFLNAVKQDCIKEDTIIEVTVKTSDGKTLSSNIKLKSTDIQAICDISEIAGQK